MNSLLRWDAFVSDSLFHIVPHNQFFDALFLVLSAQGLTICIWGILFLYYVNRERIDGTARPFLLSFFLSFGSTWFVVNIILKNIFMRVRPWMEAHQDNLFCPIDFSFPSGHASGAFAGAVIFAHFDRKRSWLYYSIAIGISYSRIYLQCHYFLDIIFGALIGTMFAFIILRLLTWRRII